MVKVLLDSNILMDMMNDIDAAFVEMDYYDDRAISAITWMEVVVGLDTAGVLQFEAALVAADIKIIHTNYIISRLAAAIRQDKNSIKLPDAIIGATANAEDRTVVTRNPKDFGANKVRKPYRCEWDENTKTSVWSSGTPMSPGRPTITAGTPSNSMNWPF